MTATLSDAEKNVWETITNFHEQLNITFQSNQIVQDYALLNGFLSFVNSKLTRMIAESLQEQRSIYELAKANSDGPKFEIDDRTLPLILRLYWEKICYPIFKWFQAWRKMLLPKTSKEQPKYVEFRKMNAKLTKFFKSVHKFYYSIMENLVKDYDTSEIVSTELLDELNLHGQASDDSIHLDPSTRFTVLIVVTLQNCLLYLGATQRYKSLGEKVNNKYQVQDFKKSLRYLDLASLILPSFGEAHLQKGLIYIQTENIGSAVYQFTRSALARIPSSAAQTNFASIICDKNSHLRQRFDEILRDIDRKETEGTMIINREVIESYFLVLFGCNFAPQSWLNHSKREELQNGLRLTTLENKLYERISTRYIKNIEIIFEDLLTVLGGFDLLLLNSKKDGKNFDPRTTNLKDLKKSHLSYMAFTFNFITRILHIIKEAWNKNFETYHYLAMVRVVECWLKSSRAALQYSHRDENFCKALAVLLNDILRSDRFDSNVLSGHKPTRLYFFEEDVRLKEFSSIKYALTDFNDEEIFKMKDSAGRLMGFVPKSEKLDAVEEGCLRLRAVVASGQKFFVKNSCGIVWNSQRIAYEFPKKSMKQAVQVPDHTGSRSVNGTTPTNAKAQGFTKQSKHSKLLSVTELEERLRKTRQVTNSAELCYSGSSAPVAPSTFSIKPSVCITDRAAQQSYDVMHISNDSSTTLSTHSPHSDEESSVGVKAADDISIEESIEESIAESIPSEELEKQQVSYSSIGFRSPNDAKLAAPAIAAHVAPPLTASNAFQYNMAYPPAPTPFPPNMVRLGVNSNPAMQAISMPYMQQPPLSAFPYGPQQGQIYPSSNWSTPCYQQGPFQYTGQQQQQHLQGQPPIAHAAHAAQASGLAYMPHTSSSAGFSPY